MARQKKVLWAVWRCNGGMSVTVWLTLASDTSSAPDLGLEQPARQGISRMCACRFALRSSEILRLQSLGGALLALDL